MNGKKLTTLITLACALIYVFGACAGSRATPAPPAGSSSAAMSGTIKYAMIGEEPNGQKEVTTAAEEMLKSAGFDFKIDWIFIPDDEYVNKLVLICSAGEDYDICWTMPVNINQLAEMGGLAPLNDPLDKYGAGLLAAVPEAQWREVTFNGSIYGIPGMTCSASVDMNFQIRKDLRESWGMGPIKTLDDLEAYLKKFQEEFPGAMPWANESGRILYREYGEYYTPIGKELKSPVAIIPKANDDFDVVHFYKTDAFLNTIAKIREFHEAGYIEIETLKNPDSLFASDLIGLQWATTTLHERIGSFLQTRVNPDAMIENMILHPENPKHLFAFGQDNLSIFAVSKKINESVAFINWMRGSQEAYDIMSYGIEGVNYKLDGKAITYDGIPENKQYMPNNWNWSDVRFMRYDAALGTDYGPTLINWDKDAVVYSFTGFSMNQGPVITEVQQIIALQDEYIPILKNSKLDFQSNYDDFIKKLDSSGIEKVIAEVETQIRAFAGK